MKYIGGDWKRRGTHLDEPGKENVYVAKDMRYEELEDGYSYLEDILLKRKEFLDGLGIDGFSTVDPGLKKMKIDNIDVLYKYYIPWNMHYTHNEHGYGHITYSNIIKRQHNTYEVKYHYGIGKEGVALINCDKKKVDKKEELCNIHWWGSVNKLNSNKQPVKFRFKKVKGMEAPIVNSGEFVKEFTYPREQVSYRWAMPTKEIIEDIEKAYLLAQFEFFTEDNNPSDMVNDIRNDVYNRQYEIDIIDDINDPVNKYMNDMNSIINRELFLKEKEIKDKKIMEASSQRLRSQIRSEGIGKNREEPEIKMNKKQRKKKMYTFKKERKERIEKLTPEEIVEKLSPKGKPLKPEIPDILLEKEPLPEPEPEPIQEQQSRMPQQQSMMPQQQSMMPQQQSRMPQQQSMMPQQQSMMPQQQSMMPQQQSMMHQQQSMMHMSPQQTMYEQQQRTMYEQQQRAMYEQQQRAMYEQQQRAMYEQQQRAMYEQQMRQQALYEQQQRAMYEQQHLIFDENTNTWRERYAWEY